MVKLPAGDGELVTEPAGGDTADGCCRSGAPGGQVITDQTTESKR